MLNNTPPGLMRFHIYYIRAKVTSIGLVYFLLLSY